MSSSFVTGPAYCYAGVGGSISSKSFQFLGTCEDTPQVKIKHEWAPLFNSLGGAAIPADEAYQGATGFVRLDLTRYDEGVRQKTTTMPFFTGTLGTSVFGDLGTLMVTEGAAYPLVISFPYVAKATYTAAGMPAGITFVAAWLEEDDLGNLNTKGRKISLVFRCRRVFTLSTLSWQLYYYGLPGGLPAIS